MRRAHDKWKTIPSKNQFINNTKEMLVYSNNCFDILSCKLKHCNYCVALEVKKP